MTKIVALSIIALVLIGMVAGGTLAYFSDTETITNNTFSAGTIDLTATKTSMDVIALQDLKPCQTGNITVTLVNSGSNPMDVWKIIRSTSIVCDNGTDSEPELAEPLDNNIDKVIHYSLFVSTDNITWTNPIPESANYTIAKNASLTPQTDNITDQWMWIGKIAPSGTIYVRQGYHMDPSTGNWAQGDRMTFTLEFFAQQNETGAEPPPGYECPTDKRP